MSPSTQERRSPTRRIALALSALLSSGVAAVGPTLSTAAALPAAPEATSAPNTWIPTGPMSVARAGQTATLLPNGKVLVAGGGTASAALYDPSRGTWAPTGPMLVARAGQTATLLPNGKVLVAGGCCQGNFGLRTAELYDPSSGTWTLTGQLVQPRVGHTATLLPDGQVLVAGGACELGCTTNSFFNNQATAELYNPTTGTWTATGRMRLGRELQTATLLSDGKVLVAGGFYGCDDGFCSDLADAELYDPATGIWTQTGSMHRVREQHLAAVLPDGRVLVAGGLDQGGFGNGHIWTTAEIYDPTTATWTSAASMATPHVGGTATLLSDGSVLVAGGGTSVAELYLPGPGVWVAPGAMSTARTTHTATLLPHGRVLVTGGFGPDGRAQNTAELYLSGPGPLVKISLSSINFGSHLVGTHSAVRQYTLTNYGTRDLVATGVTVAGGNPGDFRATADCQQAPIPPSGTCAVSVRFVPGGTGYRSAEVAVADNAPGAPHGVTASGYGSGPFAWAPTGSMTIPRVAHTSTLLADGRVLVAGGETGPTTPLSSSELYDPATGRFTPTGLLGGPRSDAVAVRLQNGEVLIAGGKGPNFVNLSSAELFNPSTGAWTPTGAMNESGYGLGATLLPDGRVLVTGLSFGAGAEIYDPATRAWTDTPPMKASHFYGSAVLLANGQVLEMGGGTLTAELYDASTNAWMATGSMNVSRQSQTATLLPDGKVLVAGGSVPGTGTPIASAELYDSTTGVWHLTGSMNVARYRQTASLLPTGQVLVAGGCTSYCNPNIQASTELFNPEYGYWSTGPPMTVPRELQTATTLADGDLLLAGGTSVDCCTSTATAEVFTVPEVSVSPTSGPAGTQVRVTGTGFFAGESVSIQWDYLTDLTTVTTDRAGTFATVVTVPSGSPGRHHISGYGRTSRASASAVFQLT